jgi:hypothetical protein
LCITFSPCFFPFIISRAARFTISPIATISCRLSEPTSPQYALPVVMPIEDLIRHRERSSVAILIPACTALSATCPSCTIGWFRIRWRWLVCGWA